MSLEVGVSRVALPRPIIPLDAPQIISKSEYSPKVSCALARISRNAYEKKCFPNADDNTGEHHQEEEPHNKVVCVADSIRRGDSGLTCVL